ncbi:hypothetical protein LIX60_10760 [Streptomyces sp. S07_1.15]|uniref:trypsin-like serine peptidase n=1 Tax=Streptomyces sp. S07_1.15 TaxID=2873925 RepID=UPI001D14AFFE|nr:hypothetical protein [Streptomyces sp. S07_1.15]MCC3651940.1 hypothetical protein [Streptomyces sp. S07_1.15]
MRLRRTFLSLSAAAVVLLAGLETASAQSPSSGQPSPDPGATVTATARLDTGARINSADTAEELERYWTPERMRNAIPVSVEGTAQRAGGVTGDTSEGPARSTPSAPPRKDMVRPTITETAVAGKVFFTKPSDGKDYVCSASALNSSSKQMAITAGHCVHEGNGGDWMRNWAYVPRYRDGNRPFGTFAAKQYRAFNGWINDGSFDWDVAMVTTWPLNSRKLVNVTGGNGLSYNYSREQAVTVNGYPGDRDNGQRQWYCQGTTQRVGVLDGRIQLRCDFGGGSSGGPWMRQFDESSGLGYTNGVTSTINSEGWNRSSYFGDSVKQMFDDQGGAT